MKIHSFLKSSEANGPGKRAVVWVQGCNRHCEGCFNETAQTHSGGTDYKPSELIEKLEIENVEGLSVSGGEPFEQPKELAELLSLAKQKGLNTLVFTGFTYEELLEQNFLAMKYCDYLIDGPYIKNIPPKCKWAGSGNQRFLKLKNGILLKDLTVDDDFSRTAEIIIDEEGNVTLTGFFEDLKNGK